MLRSQRVYIIICTCMCACVQKQHDDIVSLHPLFFPHSELVLMVCRLLVYWFPQEGLTGLLWYPLVDPYRPYHPYLQWPGHCGLLSVLPPGRQWVQVSSNQSPAVACVPLPSPEPGGQTTSQSMSCQGCCWCWARAELIHAPKVVFYVFCVGVKLAEGLHLSKPN